MHTKTKFTLPSVHAPRSILSRVCRVQGLSCPGFVVSRVCRVQGLSVQGLSVQGLFVQGLSVQGLSVYPQTINRFGIKEKLTAEPLISKHSRRKRLYFKKNNNIKRFGNF
jgi:hypothetical protein